MTLDQLNAMAEQDCLEDWSIRGGCTDYYCVCHGKVPALVTEVRRLREWLAKIGSLADIDADERGWMVNDALSGEDVPVT